MLIVTIKYADGVKIHLAKANIQDKTKSEQLNSFFRNEIIKLYEQK